MNIRQFIIVFSLLAGMHVYGLNPLPSYAQRNLTMNRQTGSIKSGPFTLPYIIEGAGPDAMVLGNALYYSRIFSSDLRKHLRLHFCEQKGFTKSAGEVDTSLFSMEAIIDDIEHFRKTLKLDSFVLIGHSGLAFMALEYAKRYPQHVSHVVLIATSPDFSAHSFEAAEQYWEESVWPERKTAFDYNNEKISEAYLATLPGDKRWIQNYLRLTPKIWYDYTFDAAPLWDGVEIDVYALQEIWSKLFAHIDITKGLADFNRPVLLALGRYDFIVAPPCSWNPMKPLFKNVTIKVFEQSGHTPQYEQAALFDAELLTWIKKNPVGS